MLKLSGTAQLTRNSLLKICGIYFKKCCVCIIYAFANFSRKFCDSWHSTWNFAQNIFPHFEGSLLDLFSIWFWFLLFVAAVATCTHTARERDNETEQEGKAGKAGEAGETCYMHFYIWPLLWFMWQKYFRRVSGARFVCFLLRTFVFVAKCSVLEVRREGKEEKGERIADWALFKP